ncbi:MAG TPA: PKD domain-containing protein, partial [Candidatus Manganitrophaceae bacterium]|nr:PKD domain-containing protein [Candidatus Manganitrophaceae bacterium]
MKAIRFILILFLFLFWAGCGGSSSNPAPVPTANISSGGGSPAGATDVPPDPPTATVAAMTLVPSEIKLPVGGTQTFSVEAEDASGNLIKDVDISWIVSDTGIASVTAAGEVTALTVGTTVLTARHADLNKTATIEVTPPPVVPPKIASIEIAQVNSDHLKIGATQQLHATAKDASNVKIEGVVFAWTSSDSSIASVDGTGVVTALQPGAVTITASADTVTSAPVSLTVDPPQSPIAVLIPSTRQGSVPLSIRFNGMGSSDPDGIVTAYAWDFGDGTPTGTASIVDHLYQTEGSYVVTLKVTDNSGRTGTATTTINAVPPVPPGNCT